MVIHNIRPTSAASLAEYTVLLLQVIMRAIEVYGLTSKHWGHPDLFTSRQSPAENFTAFICNLNQHWSVLTLFKEDLIDE